MLVETGHFSLGFGRYIWYIQHIQSTVITPCIVIGSTVIMDFSDIKHSTKKTSYSPKRVETGCLSGCTICGDSDWDLLGVSFLHTKRVRA